MQRLLFNRFICSSEFCSVPCGHLARHKPHPGSSHLSRGIGHIKSSNTPSPHARGACRYGSYARRRDNNQHIYVYTKYMNSKLYKHPTIQPKQHLLAGRRIIIRILHDLTCRPLPREIRQRLLRVPRPTQLLVLAYLSKGTKNRISAMRRGAHTDGRAGTAVHPQARAFTIIVIHHPERRVADSSAKNPLDIPACVHPTRTGS